MTLHYVPLEPLKERYTLQLSAPGSGWFERNWIKAGIDYKRVDGDARGPDPPGIKKGSVLDAVGRSLHCFSQVGKLLDALEHGELTSDDVIFFDDFWTPGIEALPYAFHLYGVKPKCYAHLYAQSVDEFDFTHPMRGWMRHFERGIGEFLDGVFVASTLLADLVVQGGIAPREKVHVVGLPFDSEEVMSRMPLPYRAYMGQASPEEVMATGAGVWCPGRTNSVVWSSRWDAEKDPGFFMRVVRRLLEEGGPVDRETTFHICTGSPELRSNSSILLRDLRRLMQDHPDNVFLHEDLSKEEYYRHLTEAKVQFNSSLQDWVAFSLLEASVAGCWPLYPYFRSFPETLNRQNIYMYQAGDVDHAARKISFLMQKDDRWTAERIRGRRWIHERYDHTWIRQLHVMGLGDAVPLPPTFLDHPYDDFSLWWSR